MMGLGMLSRLSIGNRESNATQNRMRQHMRQQHTRTQTQTWKNPKWTMENKRISIFMRKTTTSHQHRHPIRSFICGLLFLSTSCSRSDQYMLQNCVNAERETEWERVWDRVRERETRILCLSSVDGSFHPTVCLCVCVCECENACVHFKYGQNSCRANVRTTACIKFSAIYWIYWIVWRLNQQTESRTIFIYFNLFPSDFSTIFFVS